MFSYVANYRTIAIISHASNAQNLKIGKQWKQWQTLFSWAPKSLQIVTEAMKLKNAPWKKSYDQHRQHIKKQRHYFANKGPSSQSCGFSRSHVWIWELNHKESWVPKNWCFWTVVLEKTPECPLGSKEIKPVNPEGNQFRIYFGRTDAEAETPILWPPDVKNWLIWITACWESLKVGREGDDRGWDGWMAALTQWTEVWASCRRWWWTRKPDVLNSMGLQRVRHY